ncbi:cryptic loci regulator [Wolffia australiana]
MEGEEWEICNDDGFIYKRRKRKSTADPPQQPISETEDTHQRGQLVRRKLTLLAVRERYRKEIKKLDELAALLTADGRFGGDSEVPAVELALETGDYGREKNGQEASGRLNPFGASIEELFLQVEAQEAILTKLSNICDIADSLCDVREKAVVESLLSLPVWESPRSLMASLVD